MNLIPFTPVELAPGSRLGTLFYFTTLPCTRPSRTTFLDPDNRWAIEGVHPKDRVTGHTAKINALKMSLDELRAKTDMGTERIRTLLHTHRGKLEKLLTELLAKGWAGWAQQAVELHTFYADHENQTKEGKGFFKLNDESIATVREDLATNYQALPDHHLEEVAQMLEEYRVAELEIGHQLQATEAHRVAIGQQMIETVHLSDSPREDAGPTPQETPAAATSVPPVSEPMMMEAVVFAPIPITDATEAATPTSPTSNMPLQADTCTAMEQPAHSEPTSEQTTAPADRTPEPEPSEPLQTNERAEAIGIDAAITEPPLLTTPPTDPTPPEPNILDIFDDA